MAKITKEAITNDLWALLYVTDLESAPDNWDILVLMCKALLQHHSLHFKEAHEIEDSKNWNTKDVEAHFFDTVCPGLVPSPTEFELICNTHFDFEMWEIMQTIGDPFKAVKLAVIVITNHIVNSVKKAA